MGITILGILAIAFVITAIATIAKADTQAFDMKAHHNAMMSVMKGYANSNGANLHAMHEVCENTMDPELHEQCEAVMESNGCPMMQ